MKTKFIHLINKQEKLKKTKMIHMENDYMIIMINCLNYYRNCFLYYQNKGKNFLLLMELLKYRLKDNLDS